MWWGKASMMSLSTSRCQVFPTVIHQSPLVFPNRRTLVNVFCSVGHSTKYPIQAYNTLCTFIQDSSIDTVGSLPSTGADLASIVLATRTSNGSSRTMRISFPQKNVSMPMIYLRKNLSYSIYNLAIIKSKPMIASSPRPSLRSACQVDVTCSSSPSPTLSSLSSAINTQSSYLFVTLRMLRYTRCAYIRSITKSDILPCARLITYRCQSLIYPFKMLVSTTLGPRSPES